VVAEGVELESQARCSTILAVSSRRVTCGRGPCGEQLAQELWAQRNVPTACNPHQWRCLLLEQCAAHVATFLSPHLDDDTGGTIGSCSRDHHFGKPRTDRR